VAAVRLESLKGFAYAFRSVGPIAAMSGLLHGFEVGQMVVGQFEL
jgi:hypothetical protein